MDRLTNCKNRFTVYTCIKTSCCTNIDNVYFLVKVKKKKKKIQSWAIYATSTSFQIIFSFISSNDYNRFLPMHFFHALILWLTNYI